MRSQDGMYLRTGDWAGGVAVAASGPASELVLAAAAAADGLVLLRSCCR